MGILSKLHSPSDLYLWVSNTSAGSCLPDSRLRDLNHRTGLKSTDFRVVVFYLVSDRPPGASTVRSNQENDCEGLYRSQFSDSNRPAISIFVFDVNKKPPRLKGGGCNFALCIGGRMEPRTRKCQVSKSRCQLMDALSRGRPPMTVKLFSIQFRIGFSEVDRNECFLVVLLPPWPSPPGKLRNHGRMNIIVNRRCPLNRLPGPLQ